MAVLPAGYLSISDAAHELGIAAGDVARLIDTQRLKTVELITTESLAEYRQDAS